VEANRITPFSFKKKPRENTSYHKKNKIHLDME